MKLKKKILCSLICIVIGTTGTISAIAEDIILTAEHEVNPTNEYSNDFDLDDPLSPGIRVIAYDRSLVVNCMIDDVYRFSAETFNTYMGYVPSSVKILSLPDPDSGTLLYNSEPVSVGQSISVLSLSSLYYAPVNSSESEFTFSADNTNIIRCKLRQKHTENNAPYVTDNSSVTTYTRLDTAVGGYLSGMDEDGDSVEYEIVSAPTKGIVSVVDKSTGQFIYHPYEGAHGKDSFTYRLRDYYGAYSEIAEVSIAVSASKAIIYNDMADSYYTSAVNDVVEMGIMQVSKSDDKMLFNPDEPVSRIDFLIMAMKAAGAGEIHPTSTTPFNDDSTLTDTEKGYLSVAYKLGIIKGNTINGKLLFNPDEAITGATAAVILNSILVLPTDESQQVFAVGHDIPTWAITSFCALQDHGIINSKTAPCYSELSRENVAVILSALIHKLA